MNETISQTNNNEAPAVTDGSAALRKIAKEIGDKWFIDLCELVIAHPSRKFDDKLVSDLFLSFNSGATIDHWLKAATPFSPQTTGSTTTAPTNICFDRIGPFENFRKLDAALSLEPKRNFTLVFGTNGSGKSSVCLALRCLAREDEPDTLLENVGKPNSKPSFKFRLSQSLADEEWTEGKGYGVYVKEIAYFDGKIAHSLVNNPAKPEQAIEIAPFRLDVFPNTGLLLTELDHECARQITELSQKEQKQFLKLRETCKDITFLAGSKVTTEQDRWLRGLAGIDIEWDRSLDPDKLDEAEKKLESLIKRLQPERAELLKSQLQTLNSALAILTTKSKRLSKLAEISEKSIAERRTADTQTRNGLLKSVLTTGEAEEAFLKLLKQANEIIPLAEDNELCPLCKQDLDGDASTLFGKYQKLLADAILTDIEAADKKLESYKKGRVAILNRIEGWSADNLDAWLEDKNIESAKQIANRIRQALSVQEGEFEPTDQFDSDVGQVRKLAAHLLKSYRKQKTELNELLEGQDSLEKQINDQEDVVCELKVKQFRHDADAEIDEYGKVKKILTKLETKRKNAGWQDKRTKLTQALKKANDRLIKGEFEKALDAEYTRITDGLGMDYLGVSIKMEAAKQSITLAPEISGSHKISRVLSEGEQRLHAISLFFAEANVRKPHVLVFDDPSTSFDYSYTEGVVSRLTEYADENDDAQILVFTHNWEFFTKLDVSLRMMEGRRQAGGLSFDRHALVVERCETIKVRDVKISEQRHSIQQAFAQLPNPATESQIRSICADIRAWIEGIVNLYVFCNLRQSYKTRHSATLDMTGFMKVRPLKKEYADALAKAADRTSERIHQQGGTNQLVLPTPTQLKTVFGEVDDVLKMLKIDRSNDPAFNS